MADEQIDCTALAARCLCSKPLGHVEAGDPVHACRDSLEDGCGGQWTGTHGEDDFDVKVFPGGATTFEAARVEYVYKMVAAAMNPDLRIFDF